MRESDDHNVRCSLPSSTPHQAVNDWSFIPLCSVSPLLFQICITTLCFILLPLSVQGAQSSGKPTELLRAARARMVAGDFKGAAKLYRTALNEDSRNLVALVGLGETYNLMGLYTEAESPLRRALKLSPLNPTATWALSRTYLYEGRFGHSEQILNSAIARHPDDYRLWESLGEVQLNEGHTERARTSIGRARSLNPSAERTRLLAKELSSDGERAPLRFQTHDGVFWLADGAGNSILQVPQTLIFDYGARWNNQLTGDYRRLMFYNSSSEGTTSDALPGGGLISSATTRVLLINDELRLRVNDDLSLTAGGGAARFDEPGVVRPLFDAGVTLSPTSRFTATTSYGQDIVAYTELAASHGITQKGSSSRLRYAVPQMANVDLAYYQYRYSDSNTLKGGRGSVLHEFRKGPLKVFTGYQLESLSYVKPNLFDGYFSPKRYIANSGQLTLHGHKAAFHYNYDFLVGQETYSSPVMTSQTPLVYALKRDSHFRFVATLKNSYDFNQRWRIEGSMLFYHSALSSTTGAYQAHAFLFAVNRRF